jgi:trigger factor
MKVTVENKKGLNKDLKVFVDKKTMNTYMDEKYEEIKGTVNLKGLDQEKFLKKF